MVAAPFRRIEDAAEPRLAPPPRSLDIADFLIGNPEIQGSTLVVRLSAPLEAGMFDESLPSCTDRDLYIRLAELPGLRYGATLEQTANHLACDSRERLSAPGSVARTEGLDRFFRKCRGRMEGRAMTEKRWGGGPCQRKPPPLRIACFGLRDPVRSLGSDSV